MAYIAKISLPHKGGFIKPGDKVPEDYNRFHEGIRRGWIEVMGGPAAMILPVADEPITSSPPITSDPIHDQPIAASDVVAPEEPPAYIEPVIEDIDYLLSMAKKSLASKQIVTIRDLDGWGLEALVELSGIGPTSAERLLEDFAEYAKWKESFSEYTEPTEAEYGNEPGDEDAETETDTGESGEDESPQDD